MDDGILGAVVLIQSSVLRDVGNGGHEMIDHT